MLKQAKSELTNYAFCQVMKQYALGHALHEDNYENPGQIEGETVDAGAGKCTCLFYQQYELPCAHMLYLWNLAQVKTVARLGHRRWL